MRHCKQDKLASFHFLINKLATFSLFKLYFEEIPYYPVLTQGLNNIMKIIYNRILYSSSNSTKQLLGNS